MDSSQQQIIFKTRLRNLAHGGAAVGEISECQAKPEITGKTAFVPACIPGEEIEALLENDHKNLVEGKLLNIISASESRIQPPCSYFGECGGCNFQHIELGAQRKFKLDMVKSYLERHAAVEDTSAVSLYGTELAGYGYRRRVIFHLNRQGQIGFYHKKTRRIIAIDKCLIAVPEINQALGILAPVLHEFGGMADDLVLEFCEGQLYLEVKLRPRLKGDKPQIFSEALAALLADKFVNLTISFCAIPLFISQNGKPIKAEEREFPVGHFSQVNQDGNLILQELTCQFSGDSQEITELFAGAGNFTFPLARQAGRIIAVEADRELVRYGVSMAARMGLADRVEFVRKSCEKYVRKNKLLPCLVVDPPRCGAQEVMEKIDPELTKKIVYISCALPTLCRDLKILKDKGFVLEQTRVVDMFPQTHHVETVSLLQIKSSLPD